jgi:lipopolysaccharide export system protein LptA
VKCVRYKPFFLVATLLVGLAVTDSVGSEVLEKQTEKDNPRPIVIKSKTLEVNDKTKVVTFEGDVRAEISVKGDDFVIDCKKMLVYYKNPPSQQQKAESLPPEM